MELTEIQKRALLNVKDNDSASAVGERLGVGSLAVRNILERLANQGYLIQERKYNKRNEIVMVWSRADTEQQRMRLALMRRNWRGQFLKGGKSCLNPEIINVLERVDLGERVSRGLEH